MKTYVLVDLADHTFAIVQNTSISGGRVGNTADTRGTAFVIYEDIFDAKNACDHLSGFNVCNR